MELIVDKSFNTLETTYTLKITYSDMDQARIRPEDHVLFDDCNRKESSISDKLLALETLARRIEEGNE